ncbi:DNA polymerase IV [Tumebacillus sp. ITR2]|uniref:DNA polymerase IV n=1 Tax=Tumebacillus amylolyticus TaxID=2801339 RepID=A0ABS1J735_9BACL|nr:DNA polymerase IV [Tumebacillus amylolyticus]
MSRAEYREQVLTFARQAKEFYFTAIKTETDEYVEEFWKEYDDLLNTV